MPALPNEPSILERVTIETLFAHEWVSHAATIANLTTAEVWLGLNDAMVGLVAADDPARIVLGLPDGGALVSETSVVRLIGADGKVVVLARPESWRFPSRRTNGRVNLAIPAYLRPVGSAVVSARTTNIGVGGFHCVAALPVTVGHQMPVSLLLTPVTSFDCMAQVVRIDDQPDDANGTKTVIAFRFMDLADDDEATIAAALIALSGDTDADSVPKAWHSGSHAGASEDRAHT